MTQKTYEYDVVVVGAGLSGLTADYTLKKLKPNLSVLVIERSETAGGLTGNWIDDRFGPDKKLQMPMHMIFKKYTNFRELIREIGGSVSPEYTGYNIITGDGVRHRLEMNDWTSRHLPTPLHTLGMFAKLRMPLREKYDLFKLACVSTYCAREIANGVTEPSLVPNTLSLEGLELLLRMGAASRDFLETVTPSIYNLHPWYTSPPRMAAVMAGTITMSPNALHHQVFAKNYNAAFIDRYVEKLRKMGVDFLFRTEARRLDGSQDGQKVASLWVKPYGPEVDSSTRFICDNCGAENYAQDRAFCTRCGLDTTLDKIAEGKIRHPVHRELWMEAEKTCREIRFQYLITAMYPHMIAKLIPTDSGLRKHPYVRSFYSARGNQTQLSVGRVYYNKPVTRGDRWITGTHNPYLSFNGCQSVLNNFGSEDLGYPRPGQAGDVLDVLLDVGVIRDAHSQKEQIERIVRDLQRVYPDADPTLVQHVSFANIYPDVLYLSEQPAINGLHRFFNTHRTGAKNWYVAGCHSGMIGIGMESAIESARSAVNCLLEDMGVPERVTVHGYPACTGSRIAASLGKALLWWKFRGRSPKRLAGSTYSFRYDEDHAPVCPPSFLRKAEVLASKK